MWPKFSDILFLQFSEYVRLHRERSKEILASIHQAPIVCIDDVHPENDNALFHIILELFEARIANGLFGTFVTTNLEPQALVGESADEIQKRFLDRINSFTVSFNFESSRNWRSEVLGRRVKNVNQFLDRQLQEAKR